MGCPSNRPCPGAGQRAWTSCSVRAMGPLRQKVPSHCSGIAQNEVLSPGPVTREQRVTASSTGGLDNLLLDGFPWAVANSGGLVLKCHCHSWLHPWVFGDAVPGFHPCLAERAQCPPPQKQELSPAGHSLLASSPLITPHLFFSIFREIFALAELA